MIGKDEMKAAFDSLPKDQQGVLERAAERIRVFAQAQRDAIRDVEIAVPGGAAGHEVSPVRTAGCYAPGGRYPLPSSVLMTAVTARVAGVERVWVASPRPAHATIAAAHVAGADALLRVGGAQAIAAMAYGVGKVDPCDVIVGPGNRWVTAAKSLVSGRCGIDMLAGPSECLVLADGKADPALIAADLLAQAEHDTDALPVLVTDSDELADAVDVEISRQLAILPTRDTAGVSVRKGFTVVCSSMDEAAAVSDTVAPEHLEVMTENPKEFAQRLRNYGGLFVGARSAEVLGDYGIGPNHVLPTSGTGRYTGGLSVFTFLRIRTWLRSDEALAESDEFQGAVKDAAALARIEGLRAHERAALRRVTDGGAALAAVEEADSKEEKEREVEAKEGASKAEAAGAGGQ